MCESSLNGDFVIVSYPGCVKNVEKALETLGGLQTISSVRSFFFTAKFQFY